jgi:putative component of membrane protein insertase Oxa1/YidC/SpoIIIJ protein YidD
VFLKKSQSHPSITPLLHYSIFFSPQIRIASVLLLAFFCLATPGYAAPFKGPWDQGSRHQNPQKQIGSAVNPMRFLVEAYRRHISPIDGKDCPMHPSCSEYSIRCFKKHGFFIGWMMTCDRLFRCGRDEVRLSPHIVVNGKSRCYDPPENNDFWWGHDQ